MQLYHTKLSYSTFYSFFWYGNPPLEFYKEITIKFLLLSWAAWAHCQMSITQLSFIGTQKERNTRTLFWLNSIELIIGYQLLSNKLLSNRMRRWCLDSKTFCHFSTSLLPICDWYILTRLIVFLLWLFTFW